MDIGHYTPFMHKNTIFLLITACALASWANNPWQWVDEAGRTTYSDQPPSPSGPPVQVLRRPGEAAPPPTLGAEPVRPPPASPASAPAPKSAQEDRLRALQESNSRLRAARCAQVRQAWSALESGQRIARTSPTGEREVLDDAARATERVRLQGILASECPSA
jgi:hypothetical protein